MGRLGDVMGLLMYNHAAGRYEGDRLFVPRDVFEDCVAKLVGGVELLDNRLCLHCRGLLEPPQQRICDVVCQAAFYAEAHR
jgi:hypothetical protein